MTLKYRYSNINVNTEITSLLNRIYRIKQVLSEYGPINWIASISMDGNENGRIDLTKK